LGTLKEFKDKYKNIGGFKQAVSDIKMMIGIQSNSFKNWNGLFTFYSLKKYREDSFFISEEAKLIFALTQLDGENRAELMGITKKMYSSLAESKNWYRKNTSKLHPDRCSHPQAYEAVAKLNNIYERMKKHGE